MEKLKIIDRNLNILQICPFFSPNIGGVETHLDDLLMELSKKGIKSTVITYQPTMSNIKAPSFEKIGDFITIRRIEIIRNLFLKIEPYPILDFLFLTPPLLFYSIYFLIFKNKENKINIVHTHGLNAAFIGMVLKFLFKVPFIVSTHATYSFSSGMLSFLVKLILSNADHILTLSRASKDELIKIGINSDDITVYKYWVDQDRFSIKDKTVLRKKYNLGLNDFIVLFAGRLFEKKGVIPLIEGFNMINDGTCKLLIAGSGPLEEFVKESCNSNNNIIYIGALKSQELSDYYSLANTLIIPSTHDEGFGRVILEALSCGIPIIGSNRGGIPEAINKDVGILIDVTPEAIKESINEIKDFIKKKNDISKICRDFAKKEYSCDNITTFITVYEKILR